MTTVTDRLAQVFVTLRSGDPEASSALAVARRCLEGGGDVLSLRRLRLFELRGELPDDELFADLLHRSIQFYNPSKETVVLRNAGDAPSPLLPGEAGVLVFERGGERRPAAERWWRHAGGGRIEVREGVVWAVRFGPGDARPGRLEALAVSTGRASGLLCNPHAQEWRMLPPGDAPPLDWISRKVPARRIRRRGGTPS